jgi:hypothetical protein
MLTKFVSKLFAVFATVLFSTFAQAQDGLRVWNINGSDDAMDVEILMYTGASNLSGCSHVDVQESIGNLTYDQFYNAHKVSHDFVCLNLPDGQYSSHFTTLSLVNVPECEVQIFQYDMNIWTGKARASTACGYTQNCVDGKAYEYNDRHLSVPGTEEYDTFAKVCLPYKPD